MATPSILVPAWLSQIFCLAFFPGPGIFPDTGRE